MTSVALADELLLLAYDDDTGRCAVPLIALDLGMAAAVLVDLLLRGRIGVANGAVVPVSPSPTGHDTDDEVLRRICAEQPQPVAFWLQRLRHNLRQHLLEGLIAGGVIRDQDVTAWDVLRVHRFPVVDPTTERDTRARLAAALAGQSVPDERTAALAALVAAVRMEPALGLAGDAVGTTHRRLVEIARGAGLGPSVGFLVDELHRAVHAALGPARQ
jgi:Golgi phosphoprotein 3 GPP34